jgi:hypothetical protein
MKGSARVVVFRGAKEQLPKGVWRPVAKLIQGDAFIFVDQNRLVKAEI